MPYDMNDAADAQGQMTASEDEQAGMVAVEVELLAADRKAHNQGSFPEWFLGQLKQADALDDEVKEQYKRFRAQIAARRRALILTWGKEFRRQVKEDLDSVNAGTKGKPRKIMKYLTGQAGTRKAQDKIVVQDDKVAAKWAWEHCKAACDIVLARTTPLLDHVKASRKTNEATGEETMEQIPGCTFVAGHDAPSPKLEPLDALPDQAPPPADKPALATVTPDVPNDSFDNMLVPPERPFGEPF